MFEDDLELLREELPSSPLLGDSLVADLGEIFFTESIVTDRGDARRGDEEQSSRRGDSSKRGEEPELSSRGEECLDPEGDASLSLDFFEKRDRLGRLFPLLRFEDVLRVLDRGAEVALVKGPISSSIACGSCGAEDTLLKRRFESREADLRRRPMVPEMVFTDVARVRRLEVSFATLNSDWSIELEDTRRDESSTLSSRFPRDSEERISLGVVRVGLSCAITFSKDESRIICSDAPSRIVTFRGLELIFDSTLLMLRSNEL